MDRTVLYTDSAHTIDPEDFVRLVEIEGQPEGKVIRIDDEGDTLVIWIEDEGQFCDRVPYDVNAFSLVEFLGYGE